MSYLYRHSFDGLFVNVEGLPRAGVTSNISRLATDLEKEGYAVVVLEDEAKRINAVELMKSFLADAEIAQERISRRAKLLLYAAYKAQLTYDVIVPALKRGAVVLAERLSHPRDPSHGLEDGLAKELGRSFLSQVHATSLHRTFPDFTYILDVNPKTSAQRANPSGGEKAISKDVLRFEAIRKQYLVFAQGSGDRFRIIDANGAPNDVYNRFRKSVFELARDYSDRDKLVRNRLARI